MKRKLKNPNSLVILLTVFLSTFYGSCSQFQRLVDEGKEQQTTIHDETYRIDTRYFLELLKRSGDEAFSSITQIPQNSELNPELLVNWSQDEYYEIAQTFHRKTWDESMDGWKLRIMSFNYHCEDILQIQSAHFEFFKIMQNKEKNSRLSSDIYVLADESRIRILGVEYYPEIEKWSAIDISKTIALFDAVQIAETNGGSQARHEANNKCLLKARYVADSKYNGWVITYSSTEESLKDFKSVYINAETGKIEELQ